MLQEEEGEEVCEGGEEGNLNKNLHLAAHDRHQPSSSHSPFRINENLLQLHSLSTVLVFWAALFTKMLNVGRKFFLKNQSQVK